MTDDERVTLRELISEQIRGLREELHAVKEDVTDIKDDVKKLKDNQSGMITWRALGFAVTTIITVLTFAWVITHA